MLVIRNILVSAPWWLQILCLDIFRLLKEGYMTYSPFFWNWMSIDTLFDYIIHTNTLNDVFLFRFATFLHRLGSICSTIPQSPNSFSNHVGIYFSRLLFLRLVHLLKVLINCSLILLYIFCKKVLVFYPFFRSYSLNRPLFFPSISQHLWTSISRIVIFSFQCVCWFLHISSTIFCPISSPLLSLFFFLNFLICLFIFLFLCVPPF